MAGFTASTKTVFLALVAALCWGSSHAGVCSYFVGPYVTDNFALHHICIVPDPTIYWSNQLSLDTFCKSEFTRTDKNVDSFMMFDGDTPQGDPDTNTLYQEAVRQQDEYAENPKKKYTTDDRYDLIRCVRKNGKYRGSRESAYVEYNVRYLKDTKTYAIGHYVGLSDVQPEGKIEEVIEEIEKTVQVRGGDTVKISITVNVYDMDDD